MIKSNPTVNVQSAAPVSLKTREMKWLLMFLWCFLLFLITTPSIRNWEVFSCEPEERVKLEMVPPGEIRMFVCPAACPLPSALKYLALVTSMLRPGFCLCGVSCGCVCYKPAWAGACWSPALKNPCTLAGHLPSFVYEVMVCFCL